MVSYWIWNYGDYEVYHTNLVNSRRQELGVDYPAFWRFYDVDRYVEIYREVEIEKDGYIKLFVNGLGYIFVDGVRVGHEIKTPISKGKHEFKICLCNLTGLPAAYIESGVCPTDGNWYTLDGDMKKIKVGFEKQYNKPELNPENFIFEYEKKVPVSKEKVNNGILFDFGKELFGYLNIDNVEPSEKIHVSYGESKEEAVDTAYSILFEDVSGEKSYKLRQRAFRYIFIEGSETAEITADFEYLPMEYKGSFRCDNEDINKIWDMCAYTLHVNIREVLTEAIKRDRWLWGGDSYQAFKFNRYLFDDKEIVRRSLIGLRGKEPFIQHINKITDYSFYWVIGLYEYYMDYGDIEFIKQIYQRAKTLMEFSAKRVNKDGFITGIGDDWIFIDWSEIDKGGAICAEQMLFIAANRAMANLSKLLGEEYGEYEKTADLIIKKMNDFFWNEEKGAFIDCYESGKNNVTRHANIFAIMYDIATDSQREKIVKNVLENDAIIKITTPYFEGYELDVMGKIGKFDFIENMLLSYWKGMLDEGATTVWEEYNPNKSGIEHYEMYGNKYGKSLCHAWGASPIYLLGKYYLGVTQTSKAYETFEVKPNRGRFEYIDGIVPVNGGEVRVYLSKDILKVTATKAGGVLVWEDSKYPLMQNKEIVINL